MTETSPCVCPEAAPHPQACPRPVPAFWDLPNTLRVTASPSWVRGLETLLLAQSLHNSHEKTPTPGEKSLPQLRFPEAKLRAGPGHAAQALPAASVRTGWQVPAAPRASRLTRQLRCLPLLSLLSGSFAAGRLGPGILQSRVGGVPEAAHEMTKPAWVTPGRLAALGKQVDRPIDLLCMSLLSE